jgi:hypothetical protein
VANDVVRGESFTVAGERQKVIFDMAIVIVAPEDGPVAVHWHVPEAKFEMVAWIAGRTSSIKVVLPVVTAA